jgi:hypothetical protein
MITISAFKWVPDFAQGRVRDLRARWALEECSVFEISNLPIKRTLEGRPGGAAFDIVSNGARGSAVLQRSR